MAWLFGDGFDFYNAATDISIAGTVWASATATISTTTRFGAGVSFTSSAGTGTASSITFANSTTTFLNFAFITLGTAFSAGNTIYAFVNLNDAGTKQVALAFFQDGSIGLTNNAGTVITGTRTAANTLIVSQWYHIQAKIVIDPTAGTFELRLNGSTTPTITASSLNTRNTANSYCNNVFLSLSVFATGQTLVDDFYVHNDQGAQPNTFQGDVRAVQQMPASDFSKQWTPNSGTTNYSRVNELREDGDTSYVIDATVNDVDQYAIAALATTPLSIVAVQSKMFVRMDDAGPHTVKSRLTSAGTTSDSSNLSLTTSYQWLQQTYVTDPHTSGAWTATNLNAVTIGPFNVL